MSHSMKERFLVFALLATIAALMLEHAILAAGQTASLIASALLIGAIVLASRRCAWRTMPRYWPTRSVNATGR